MSLKKIKVAIVTNHLEMTGIATVIMNYCKQLDNREYEFTIIAGRPISELYQCECREYDIKIVSLPSRHDSPLRHYFSLFKSLRKKRYDIVHVHGNSSLMAIELSIARMVGIKHRIAHCHNTVCQNETLHKIVNGYFRKTYTDALACGVMAGEWLFGKDGFKVLPNGFKTDEFYFSPSDRMRIRSQLGIKNAFVIGHLGRLNSQKNQEYILNIFENIATKKDDAILLLVGSGPDEEKIKRLISVSRYKERIFLYGETDNPSALYSAMDVFVFPSKYEGLPVVLLEAQISGMPCVVSDKITKEVDFGGLIWKSIDDVSAEWAKVIMTIKVKSDEERKHYPEINAERIKSYDIRYTKKMLDCLYKEMLFEK